MAEIRQPMNKMIYNSRNILAEVRFSPNLGSQLNNSFGIGSPLQMFWDEMLLNDINRYTFFRTGAGRQRAVLNTVIGNGELRWVGPEMRFLWFGKVMVDRDTGSAWATLGGTKIPIDRDLISHAGGITGPFWAERAKNDLMQQWTRSAQAFVDRGS